MHLGHGNSLFSASSEQQLLEGFGDGIETGSDIQLFIERGKLQEGDYFESSLITSIFNATNNGTSFAANDSLWHTSRDLEQYIFHQPYVKIPLLICYTVVFLLAFFGKYTVKCKLNYNTSITLNLKEFSCTVNSKLYF